LTKQGFGPFGTWFWSIPSGFWSILKGQMGQKSGLGAFLLGLVPSRVLLSTVRVGRMVYFSEVSPRALPEYKIWSVPTKKTKENRPTWLIQYTN